MTTALHTTRSHRGTATTKEAMEFSISDLKKPMEDASSATQATAQESYNQQSFAFLDRSMLIRPLADASEISTSARRRDGEPSIAELQSVFASQARVRTASASTPNSSKGSLMNDNSRMGDNNSRQSLQDRLQQQWGNNGSLQDSFCSIDSSAARAGSPKGEEEEASEEEDKVLKLPVLSKQSMASNATFSFMGESLLDFESVCFEPDLATEQQQRKASSQKYASGIKALAQVGRSTTAAIMGSKKEVLADASEGSSKEHSDPDFRNSRTAQLLADVSAGSQKLRSARRDKQKSIRSRSKSPSPMVVRQNSKSGRRTRRGDRERPSSTTRCRHSNREELPPPLVVDSPRESQRRARDKGTEVRRAMSSETPRLSASKARGKLRRAKSSEDNAHHHQGRTTSTKSAPSMEEVAMDIDSPHPTLEEVAMDIDLDDDEEEEESQHSLDYCYFDCDTATTEEEDCNESRRSVHLEDIKEADKAKDETKQRRSSNIMDHLVELLLEDIGTTEQRSKGSSRSDRRQPSKSRRGGSSKPSSRTDASHSSGSAGNSSGRTSQRRKQSKEP